MSRRKLIFGYAAIVGLPVSGILTVLAVGKGMAGPPSGITVPAGTLTAAVASAAATDPAPALGKLFLQIAVILIAARLAAALFQRIGQPQVIGEMAAGILLGPSLLGWLAPAASAALFPPASLGYLNALSQIGLVLFMFLVGLSLDASKLRGYGEPAVLTSHASIAVPFFLGTLVALYLYPRLSGGGASFTGFALFMGAAMSVTAFPVLARILAERDLLGAKLGNLAIASAAVDDVTGWCVLAYIIVLIRASHASPPVWFMISGITIYGSVMWFGVRRLLPWFEKSYNRRGRLTENAVAAIVLLVLASALCTESLGIHLLFGSFLMGVVMPKSTGFVEHIRQRFESLTVVLLLPLFFAYTGLRTDIRLATAPGVWIYTLLIVAVAVAGKLGGCLAAGRMANMTWKDSAALGALMNTRGLMGLVILNIGLEIGVISPAVFSMMVLMALLTTLMTTPILDVLLGVRQYRMEMAADTIAG